MTQQEFYDELKALAAQKEIKVRLEAGNFEGGLCTVDHQQVILINRRHHQTRRVNVLARALHEVGLDDLYVKPALRDRIDDEVAANMSTE
ncbi:MAG: hypothetical protein KDD67_06305 [Ignavibacteriae bacterium]|nr:hypothetical protein [Ignavibacteriota bacterium]MCB9215547.1 hypothetical protein [Ignavibacteria bacterium]